MEEIEKKIEKLNKLWTQLIEFLMKTYIIIQLIKIIF